MLEEASLSGVKASAFSGGAYSQVSQKGRSFCFLVCIAANTI